MPLSFTVLSIQDISFLLSCKLSSHQIFDYHAARYDSMPGLVSAPLCFLERLVMLISWQMVCVSVKAIFENESLFNFSDVDSRFGEKHTVVTIKNKLLKHQVFAINNYYTLCFIHRNCVVKVYLLLLNDESV